MTCNQPGMARCDAQLEEDLALYALGQLPSDREMLLRDRASTDTAFAVALAAHRPLDTREQSTLVDAIRGMIAQRVLTESMRATRGAGSKPKPLTRFRTSWSRWAAAVAAPLLVAAAVAFVMVGGSIPASSGLPAYDLLVRDQSSPFRGIRQEWIVSPGPGGSPVAPPTMHWRSDNPAPVKVTLVPRDPALDELRTGLYCTGAGGQRAWPHRLEQAADGRVSLILDDMAALSQRSPCAVILSTIAAARDGDAALHDGRSEGIGWQRWDLILERLPSHEAKE